MTTEFRIETQADGWTEVTILEDLNAAVTAPSRDDRNDGTIRLNVRFTDEGMIVDSYDHHGNCVGTIAGDWDDWDRRVTG